MHVESFDAESVQLQSALLNPGDQVRVVLVTTSQREGALGVTARIKGIARVELRSAEAQAPKERTAPNRSSIALSVLLALGVALVTAFASWFYFVDVSRPSLSVEVGEESFSPNREYKFLHVAVSNTLPRGVFAALRAPRTARGCRAFLTFRERATGRVILYSIPGDWSSTPEPLVQLWDPGQKHVVMFADITKVAARKSVSIAPGGSDTVAVAVKHSGEAACFAFNHDNYFGQPGWRLDKHRFGLGEYDVAVRIETDDSRPQTHMYLLRNSGPRLEECDLGARS